MAAPPVILKLSFNFDERRPTAMIVCSCFNVSDGEIRERARQGLSLNEILEETGAGSSCGICQLAIARVRAGDSGTPAHRCTRRTAA
jgi:bacterioferritin-associated ferredoxin